MANISLKVQSGDVMIELEGESEIVKQIFADIKDNGLGNLTLSPKLSKTIDKKTDEPQVIGVETITSKKKTSKSSKAKGTITAKYEVVDLGFDAEKRQELKDYYATFKVTTNVQRICVLSHWLKENTDIKEIDMNIIFTVLRMVGEKSSFNIPQAFLDIQKRSQYVISTGEKGKYKITPIGEDYVMGELTEKSK